MQYNSPVLFIEINDLEFSFIVGDNIGEDDFKIPSLLFPLLYKEFTIIKLWT